MISAEQFDDGSQHSFASHGETTNRSLIELVKQQEPQASKMFVGIYQPLVQHWCRLAGLKSQDIDDVCQDVFLSVIGSIASFSKQKPEDTFRGWLRTITKNRVADFLRVKLNEVPALQNVDIAGFVARLSDPEPSPATEPESRKVSMEVFRNAVTAMKAKSDERVWKAFWRTTIDEQSAPDVAEELDMTADAVRQAKSRMKRRLRLELGSLFDEIANDAGVSL